MDHYSAEALERRLADMTEPLRTELATIETVIAYHEEELSKLRASRKRVMDVLAKIEPKPEKPKPSAEPKQVVRAEEVEATRTWLEANYNGGDIWAAQLTKDKEFREATGVRSGVVTQVLSELHEQSFLTLDRVIKGGGKVYKVVR